MCRKACGFESLHPHYTGIGVAMATPFSSVTKDTVRAVLLFVDVGRDIVALYTKLEGLKSEVTCDTDYS